MILGASHIVLTTAHPDEDLRALVRHGWKMRFRERVAARTEKQRFLAGESEGEELILLDRPGSLALELIAYRRVVTADSVARVVVGGSHETNFSQSRAAERFLAALENAGESFAVEQLPGGESYLTRAEPGPTLLVQRTADIESASAFWTGTLGFAAISQEPASPKGRTRELAFRRPLTSWSMRLRLVEDLTVDATASSLDALGVRCVSFISSDIATDRRVLREFPGVESTGVMAYSIAGKSLQLEIFLAPGGLHVELLQAPAA